MTLGSKKLPIRVLDHRHLAGRAVAGCLVALIALALPVLAAPPDSEGATVSLPEGVMANPSPRTPLQPLPLFDVALDRDPRVLEIIPFGTLAGYPVPRPFGYMKETESVVLVIYLKNKGASAVSGVTATLSDGGAPGLQVATPSVSYGQLSPGVSTPGFFLVSTAGTPVAEYELTLTINHSLATETESVFLPVWGIEFFSLDIPSGQVSGQVRTPFSTDVISFTAPEIFDAQGNPSYFDLQGLSQQVFLNVPYNGIHWGDAIEEAMTSNLVALPWRATDGGTDGQPTEGNGGTAELHGTVKTKEGAPIPGARVSVTCPPNGTKTGTSDANGQYWIEGIPAGPCTRHVDPPAVLRNRYRASWSKPFTFEGGTRYTDGWTYPDPPPGSGPGSSGGVGGGSGSKSAKAGGLVGAGTAILNLLAAPETVGGTLLSLAGAGLIGGGTAVGADPAESDIFIAGEAATPPASTDETTFTETVSMTFNLDQPPVGGLPFQITSTFDYNRFTDANTYNWQGGETLNIPVQLLVAGTATYDAGLGGVVATASVSRTNGTTLKGGDPTVVAYLANMQAFSPPLGLALLADDGKGQDAVANDGVFTALIPLASNPGGLEVCFWAARTGWQDVDNPPLLGQAMTPVQP
jgi:hypothetical protein